jgi:hypothetical protein
MIIEMFLKIKKKIWKKNYIIVYISEESFE